MTTSLRLDELVHRLRAGDPIAVAEPVVVVDLDRGVDIDVLAELQSRTAQMATVLVGIAHTASSAPAAEDLAAFDVLLSEDDEAPAPWVACAGTRSTELAELLDRIQSSPHASRALVQLLRVGETLPVADAVVAESWTYSLLQGGERHRSWLAGRADRVRHPRPDAPVVVLDRLDDTLTITLDRPEVRNAYGTRMRDELVEALEFVALDASIERVELRGNGPAFSSGGDLDEFGTAPDPLTAHIVRTARNAGLVLTRVSHRVTAFVHGTCVGAGVELPAFSSEVVAHSGTTFLLPEIAMGLVPGAGGTASIPRRIGRQRAAWLALAGRPITASTALAWALVDRIDDHSFPTAGDAR